MTELYTKINAKIWMTYKENQREINKNISSEQLNKRKDKAKEFLGLLAFKAMINNSIMLSYELISQTIKECYGCDEEDIADYLSDLLPPGFLNTSDHNRTNG